MKFFTPLFVFLFLIFSSCGGSGTSNPSTEEEAYIVASQFVGSVITNLPTGGTSSISDAYQSEDTYIWGPYPCITSGTFEFNGTNYYNDPSAMGSWKYVYDVNFDNCTGPDLLCSTDAVFTLNGTPTITYEYRVDTHKYTVIFGGSYSYSGSLNGSCAMNMTLTFDEVPETGAVSLSGASGTMCGYDVSSIQAMQESGEDYCELLEDQLAD